MLLVHTGHANFDIKFNMYRMLFLAFKKVQMVQNTLCQILTIQQKISLPKFLIAPNREKALPLNAISKSMIFPFTQKEDFLGKLTNINITFVNYFSSMLTFFIKNP